MRKTKKQVQPGQFKRKWLPLMRKKTNLWASGNLDEIPPKLEATVLNSTSRHDRFSPQKK